MPYAIVSNTISGTHGNLKGSKLVNLSDIAMGPKAMAVYFIPYQYNSKYLVRERNPFFLVFPIFIFWDINS